MSRLTEIFESKRDEIVASRRARPLASVRAEAESAVLPLDFIRGLRAASRPALIAEVKAASPSRGQLAGRNGLAFDPVALARVYATNGAAAISVLTDAKYFWGSLAHLAAVRAALPAVPLLRKDFICDAYQIYEARAAGADAILLIVAALDGSLLAGLAGLARDLGMAALVEVHSEAELEIALRSGERLVGINNRNLHDFSVRLDTTLQLAPRVPGDRVLVTESGIFTGADIVRLSGGRGVDAVLVGEALVTAEDTAARVRELSGRSETAARARDGRGDDR
jgi:indole-3-glycerol phosphate synthase